MAGEKICRVCRTQYPADANFCLKDASELVGVDAEPDAGLVGVVLGGKFRVLRRIGGGGMGDVYEAEHQKLQKRVAIKMLHRQFLENQEALDRFEREARLAASIGHPGIVEILDFDHAPDGSHFMVMEYLQGVELRSVLHEEECIEPVRAVRIAAQVADALGAAHERGVIHRDLKPENIMVMRRGTNEVVKVLDFGVSKMRSEGAHLTRTGMIVGTPYYMSPEQARGDADVDNRTDVYSIGAVLYEMLTGKVPFYAAELHTVLMKIMMEDPAPPRELKPSIPNSIEAVTLRAMAKDREARPSSCQALHDELMSAVSGASAAFASTLAGVSMTAPASLSQRAIPIAGATADAPRLSAPHGVARREAAPLWSREIRVGPLLVGLVLLLGLGFWFFSSPSEGGASPTGRVTIHFEAIPVWTHVSREGKALCNTPCSLEFSRDQKPFEATFTYEGYISQKRLVAMDQDREIFVSLQPLTEAPLQKRPAADSKRR